MKASELRIGNYVYYEHTTHIVSGVHGNKVYSWWVKDGEPVIEYEAKDISGTQVENPYMDVVSQYKPIPLTEEWLLKFGFVNIDKGNNDFITYTDSEHNYYLQIDVRKKDNKYVILDNSFDDLRAFSMIDIQYVHQLQNLYFALYGIDIQCN